MLSPPVPRGRHTLEPGFPWLSPLSHLSHPEFESWRPMA